MHWYINRRAALCEASSMPAPQHRFEKEAKCATCIADICCIADNCCSTHLDRCALPLVYAAHIRFLHAVTTLALATFVGGLCWKT